MCKLQQKCICGGDIQHWGCMSNHHVWCDSCKSQGFGMSGWMAIDELKENAKEIYNLTHNNMGTKSEKLMSTAEVEKRIKKIIDVGMIARLTDEDGDIALVYQYYGGEIAMSRWGEDGYRCDVLFAQDDIVKVEAVEREIKKYKKGDKVLFRGCVEEVIEDCMGYYRLCNVCGVVEHETLTPYFEDDEIQEMTLAEVNKELGKKVKIIEG